jgi:hypothetical protein
MQNIKAKRRTLMNRLALNYFLFVNMIDYKIIYKYVNINQ